ncbi:MAG: catalase, partial [Cytophagales bacterium]|nr:catalase [Cytophagales bacterium]
MNTNPNENAANVNATHGNGKAANGAAAPQIPGLAQHDTLTTRQGHPVYDNQNIRTVGNRGP